MQSLKRQRIENPVLPYVQVLAHLDFTDALQLRALSKSHQLTFASQHLLDNYCSQHPKRAYSAVEAGLTSIEALGEERDACEMLQKALQNPYTIFPKPSTCFATELYFAYTHPFDSFYEFAFELSRSETATLFVQHLVRRFRLFYSHKCVGRVIFMQVPGKAGPRLFEISQSMPSLKTLRTVPPMRLSTDFRRRYSSEWNTVSGKKLSCFVSKLCVKDVVVLFPLVSRVALYTELVEKLQDMSFKQRQKLKWDLRDCDTIRKSQNSKLINFYLEFFTFTPETAVKWLLFLATYNQSCFVSCIVDRLFDMLEAALVLPNTQWFFNKNVALAILRITGRGYLGLTGEKFLKTMRCSDSMRNFLCAMPLSDKYLDMFVAAHQSQVEFTKEYAEKAALWPD
jgi:hypothetical protein